MLKLEIVSNSLQVSQGSSIILVIPKDTLAIDTLQLSLDIPKAYIYNKYQGVTTPVLQEILSDCQDSSGTTFTPSSFIAFAETNFGSSGGGGGTTFDGQLVQDGNPVSEANPLPVSVTELPLPTGAATSEKQTEANETLVKLDKNTSAFYTEDVEEDTSNNTTFVGKQTKDGVWLLQRIVETTVGTVTTTSMEYASVLNNATKTTYASAWTDRATLTYSEIKNLL